MLKLNKIAILTIAILMALISGQYSHASEVIDGVVISQVQTGDTASASNEFIQLHNNSAIDVDITNWCLHYSSASSSLVGNKLVCFATGGDNIHVYLPSYSTVFIASNQYKTSKPDLESDYLFSATLSGTAGHIRLIDNVGQELDKIGWGVTAIAAEGDSPVTASTPGTILSRKSIDDNHLQDTDINSQDFVVALSNDVYSYGLVYEVYDVCLNLEYVQTVVPDGYYLDTNNNCQEIIIDVCLNIDDIQLIVPDGFYIDDKQQCVEDTPDVCDNMDGVQNVVPLGYGQSGITSCTVLPLTISEVMPNAIGNDIGGEYIEVYNPNDVVVDLSLYFIHVGLDNDKKYSFPDDTYIEPGEYRSFYNSVIKFTLVNTNSKVALVSVDDNVVYETSDYSSPEEGWSWALIDDNWQYTNRPTPDSKNLASVIDDKDVVVASSLKACPIGQERNPDTNKCRLIAAKTSSLVPCKVGQYRSEETNRCRNIANDVASLVPCAEGQERNPATNRCRSIETGSVLGTSDLVPCKEGQERNPETNRCRNIVGPMPEADFALVQTDAVADNSIFWWSLSGVGVVAVCYGIWEWRQEIAKFAKRLSGFIHFNK